MERSQEKFILDQLNSYPACEIKEKYTDKLEEVSTPAVRNILNQKFVSGSDMKAVLCLFDTIFLSTSNKNVREKGLYNLSKHIHKWITKMKKLPVKSVEGFVYMTDIFSKDIQVVIKIPQTSRGFESMVREYFIGIRALNKLRYLIPAFVYTLGSFLCSRPTAAGKICTSQSASANKTAFVLYEKIPGESMESLLESPTFTFNQWLLVFIQLLLGLEVAQREVRFTHFDLHTGNVMVRRKDNFNYTVPLDGTSYHVNDPELIPVVIDFGMACAYVEDRYVGSYAFSRYGMLNFMVPGYDMYKFMIYSISFGRKSPALQKQIMKLFRFYGSNDPYDIFTKGLVGVHNAAEEYCKMASFSKAATYTPLMLMEWLWKEYRNELQPHITVTDRMQYLPIRYSSTLKEYDDIFNYNTDGRDKAIKLADECIHLKPSYVMTKYNVKVLEKYNKGLQSPELASRIKGINIYLSASEGLLAVDMARLEKVFDIQIPSRSDLSQVRDRLLDIGIRHSTVQDKRDAIKSTNILKYQEKLNPYMQFYFTILELNLENKFTDWIQRFHASDIYRLYVEYATANERMIRWAQTLQASIM